MANKMATRKILEEIKQHDKDRAGIIHSRGGVSSEKRDIV